MGLDRRMKDISPVVLRGENNNASGFTDLVNRRQINIFLMVSIFSVTYKARSPAAREVGRRGLRDLRRADDRK